MYREWNIESYACSRLEIECERDNERVSETIINVDIECIFGTLRVASIINEGFSEEMHTLDLYLRLARMYSKTAHELIIYTSG